jgi:hypothetical protein
MSELRNQLEAAKAEYRSIRYDGDLAGQLLPNQKSSPLLRLRWILPVISGALAALVAVAVWLHQPNRPGIAVKPTPVENPALTWAINVAPLSEHYHMYASDVRSGVRQAMTKLSDDVEGALDAPLVNDGVAGVRHVAGELQEFASVTWSQLKPRRGPGC